MDADLEKLRNSAIPGYTHPETQSTQKSAYKTYNKKNGLSTATEKVYNNFDASYTEKCPTCNKKVFEICSCDLKERYCEDNHVWWYDKTLKLRNENPHEMKKIDFEDEIRFIQERKKL
jgi:hypothetical protein